VSQEALVGDTPACNVCRQWLQQRLGANWVGTEPSSVDHETDFIAGLAACGAQDLGFGSSHLAQATGLVTTALSPAFTLRSYYS